MQELRGARNRFFWWVVGIMAAGAYLRAVGDPASRFVLGLLLWLLLLVLLVRFGLRLGHGWINSIAFGLIGALTPLFIVVLIVYWIQASRQSKCSAVAPSPLSR